MKPDERNRPWSLGKFVQARGISNEIDVDIENFIDETDGSFENMTATKMKK